MEQIVHYFENIPAAHRSFIIVGGITLFWIIEDFLPFSTSTYKKWAHGGINIFFTLTTIVINFF